MTDLYEFEFTWPHPEANTVIATGTFDGWSSSLHLQRTPTGFVGKATVPWDTKLLFKFIVDGHWTNNWELPIERDLSGNVNNVAFTPKKPEVVAAPAANGFALPEKASVSEPAPEPPAPAPEPEVVAAPAPAASEPEAVVEIAVPVSNEVEVKSEEPKAKDESPVEVTTVVPMKIVPVKDATTENKPEEPPVPESSTHAPASVAEVEAAEKPVAEPAPVEESIPAPAPAAVAAPVPAAEAAPPPESSSEAAVAAPVPAPVSKAAEEPARPSTPPPKPTVSTDAASVTSTPAPSAPATPSKANGHSRSATTATGMLTPPTSSAPSTPKKAMSLADSEGATSPGSPPFLGRQKRQSFFGKIKAKLSPSKEKPRKGSMSPSPLPSPKA